MTTNQIVQLSDDALIDAVVRAAGTERQSTADLLSLLMEVDRRRLYLRQWLLVDVRVMHARAFGCRSRRPTAASPLRGRRGDLLVDELSAGNQRCERGATGTAPDR